MRADVFLLELNLGTPVRAGLSCLSPQDQQVYRSCGQSALVPILAVSPGHRVTLGRELKLSVLGLPHYKWGCQQYFHGRVVVKL